MPVVCFLAAFQQELSIGVFNLVCVEIETAVSNSKCFLEIPLGRLVVLKGSACYRVLEPIVWTKALVSVFCLQRRKVLGPACKIVTVVSSPGRTSLQRHRNWWYRLSSTDSASLAAADR